MQHRLVAFGLATALALPTALVSAPAQAAEVTEAPALTGLTPAVGGWHPRAVTATFGTAAPGVIRCAVDSGAFGDCPDGRLSAVLSGGTHTLRARIEDAGSVGPETTVPVKVDATAPRSSITKSPRFTKSRGVSARWSATDGGSGVASHQVATQVHARNAKTAAWTYPANLSALTQRSASLVAPRGSTVCWKVRARDRVGNVGEWTARSCGATLFDERGLPRSKAWKAKRSSKAFLKTYVQTKRTRASIRLPATYAKQVALVATTCRTCGTVDLVVNGVIVEIIDLYSPRTRHGVVITHRTKAKSKPVRIKIVSSTFGISTARIEGFGLSRF